MNSAAGEDGYSADDGPRATDREALWLAACLARESSRPDRLLADPYAERLAGPRGLQLYSERTARWPPLAAVISAAIVDDLVHRVVFDHHLHTVVQLGGALDTRPFRLGLPGDLRWVELEDDALLLYKGFRLAHAVSHCQVERVSVNLADVPQRNLSLRRALRGVARGLLLTENALHRFQPDALRELGASVPGTIKWWIAGVAATGRPSREELIVRICASRWQVRDCRPLDDEARRLVPSRSGLAEVTASDVEPGVVWLLRRTT